MIGLEDFQRMVETTAELHRGREDTDEWWYERLRAREVDPEAFDELATESVGIYLDYVQSCGVGIAIFGDPALFLKSLIGLFRTGFDLGFMTALEAESEVSS